MANFLSTVSGQFSKALILGTFFPTALFAVLGWIILGPLLPQDWTAPVALSALDPQWQLAAVTLLTIVLSGVLYNLNTSIIRFYEGYPWLDTTFGRRRQQHYANERAEALLRQRRVLVLSYAVPDSAAQQALTGEWNLQANRLSTQWPVIYKVLPTQLGNVIRSFEDYPYRQYGIESITLWPRLLAKIDEKYSAVIDASKVPFDFMLNSSLLSGLLATSLLLAGLLYPTRLAYADQWAAYLPWLVEMLVFGVLSVIFYHGAIGSAAAWGALVKGAFDLYKADLLAQLGYKAEVWTREQERAVWKSLSLQLQQGDKPEGGARLDYDPAPAPPPKAATSVSAHGNTSRLTVTRGVQRAAASTGLTVFLHVANTHAAHDAPGVAVTDQLPAGFEYEWGSARLGGQATGVEGTNPYTFSVGLLVHGTSATVQYNILPRVAGTPPAE